MGPRYLADISGIVTRVQTSHPGRPVRGPRRGAMAALRRGRVLSVELAQTPKSQTRASTPGWGGSTQVEMTGAQGTTGTAAWSRGGRIWRSPGTAWQVEGIGSRLVHNLTFWPAFLGAKKILPLPPPAIGMRFDPSYTTRRVFKDSMSRLGLKRLMAGERHPVIFQIVNGLDHKLS